MRIPALLAGTYTPHCARIDPARLVRGLADACERAASSIYERSPATAIAPGRVDDERPGRSARPSSCGRPRRSRPGSRASAARYLPLASHMLATEPLPPRDLGRDRLGGLRADRRPALPVRLHAADAGRADRARRSRAHATSSAARSAKPTRCRPRFTASSSRHCAGCSRPRPRCPSATAGAASSRPRATGA